MNLDKPQSKVTPSRRTKLDSANSECPVELSIKIIGGKWKPILLWQLNEKIKRFGELKKDINGITVKMLAQQLRELEQDGIISRKMYHEVPPRVEYSLTEMGRSLEPVLMAMCSWGKMYKEKMLSK
ncbi:MAG: helix-turn-helix transcriptional regulator [Bdellovibrionales bacterium]|nr:helix-turn-helix transcriptional regulator [Bdellovibrionales bacterium]